MVPIRLAIVGCGAVAEGFYAPALRGFQGFSPVVMVDRQLHRAELLKSYFQSCAAETDFTALRERVDAAIVALPNDLNAMVATRLVQAGISVLVTPNRSRRPHRRPPTIRRPVGTACFVELCRWRRSSSHSRLPVRELSIQTVVALSPATLMSRALRGLSQEAWTLSRMPPG